MMLHSLKHILSVQELDIKMIRLMRLKKERLRELNNINSLRTDLQVQLEVKGQAILDLKKEIRIHEGRIVEVKEKIQKFESQQNKVKKVEEFNALSQEIASAEREKSGVEQRLSDIIDKQHMEEETLESIKQSIKATDESSQLFEKELKESIHRINEEGVALMEERKKAAKAADHETLGIYEKLLHNKKDRVVVAIENRTCSGCHIVLTAQHENMVRKGQKMVFCEHCSRILYWLESEAPAGAETAAKRRRRRTPASV